MHIECLSVLAIVPLQPTAVALLNVECAVICGYLLVALVGVEVVEGQCKVNGSGLGFLLCGWVELADLGEVKVHGGKHASIASIGVIAC